MQRFFSYILSRGSELSTWKGLFLFLSGAFGFDVSPDVQMQVATALMAFSGLIAMLLPDKLFKSTKEIQK